jgi:hypothetical protein
MSVTEQRYKAVQGVLADGRTVGEVPAAVEVLVLEMRRAHPYARQTLDALKEARAYGPPPYWSRRLTFTDLPRTA